MLTQSVNHNYTATTERNTPWSYDPDGRMLADGWSTLNVYDEAGGLRNVWGSFSGSSFVQDGDGQKAKKVEESTATYYLHSTVLGQTIAEIEGTSRMNGFVYADGQLIATQAGGGVFWQHTDPSARSRRTTIANGDGTAKDEVDPFDVKLDPPGLNNHNTGTGGGGKSAGGAEARVASLLDLGSCDFEGMVLPCGMISSLQEHVSSGWDDSWDKVPVIENGPAHDDLRDTLDDINNLDLDDSSRIRDDEKWVLNPSPQRPKDPFQERRQERRRKKKRDKDGDASRAGEAASGAYEPPYKGKCPPTKETLEANLVVRQNLNDAMSRAESRKVEHGGWIFWNPRTGKISALIKEPYIDALNLKMSDNYFQVFLNNPPQPPPGSIIVGTFHTHLENFGPNDFDVAVDDSRKVPGLVRTPDGNIYPYGNHSRGVWKKEIPTRCNR